MVRATGAEPVCSNLAGMIDVQRLAADCDHHERGVGTSAETIDFTLSLPAIRPTLPAAFETCDPRAEYSSPPGSPELHFHYRFFSVALTEARRRKQHGVGVPERVTAPGLARPQSRRSR